MEFEMSDLVYMWFISSEREAFQYTYTHIFCKEWDWTERICEKELYTKVFLLYCIKRHMRILSGIYIQWETVANNLTFSSHCNIIIAFAKLYFRDCIRQLCCSILFCAFLRICKWEYVVELNRIHHPHNPPNTILDNIFIYLFELYMYVCSR